MEDSIELNYSLIGGSGHGADMLLYLPVSFFAGLGTEAHLQMYSLFGSPNNNNNGFEEWSYLSCAQTSGAVCYTPPPVEAPEPGSLALLGMGLLGFGTSRRRSTR